MIKAISRTAREAQDAVATSDGEVVLIKFMHPDLEVPVRVSSDDADIISMEPYMRGTYSTWLSDDGSPVAYPFVGMGVKQPDDATDAPAQASLVLDPLDSRLSEVLTSTIIPANVDFAVVMRSSPNFVERQYRGLLLVQSDGDGGLIALSFSRRAVLEEPSPSDRTSKERFPGMHA